MRPVRLLTTVLGPDPGLRGLGRPQMRLRVVEGDAADLVDGVHCAQLRAGGLVVSASIERCGWSSDLVVHPVEPFPRMTGTTVEVDVNDRIRTRMAVGSAAELVVLLDADAAAVTGWARARVADPPAAL